MLQIVERMKRLGRKLIMTERRSDLSKDWNGRRGTFSSSRIWSSILNNSENYFKIKVI